MGNINDIILSTPLALESSNDVDILGLYYLPYSTGFEVECDVKSGCNKTAFTSIPNIMEADINNYEQRFRIPNGLDGLKCLYRISLALKQEAEFNPLSGIHYHVDCTDVYHLFTKEFINEHSKWILEELDTWNYKGTYNPRSCEFSSNRNWTRFKSSTQTMEFRIGEMTFDYELLVKRIIHCNKIVRTLKNDLIETNEESIIKEYDLDYEKIINNRVIKL